MVLPTDYEEEFAIHTNDGAFRGTIYSKMFCHDKAVFWRAGQSQLLRLADHVRMGESFELTSSMNDQRWTVGSLEELRAWAHATGRGLPFDAPRHDPYELRTESGFSVILHSHLDPCDAYAINTNPLAAAIAELRSASLPVIAVNQISGTTTTLSSEIELVEWAIRLHEQLGRQLDERRAALKAHAHCLCSRCRPTTTRPSVI